MDTKTKIWVKLMDWCSKYWGCHQFPERSFFYKGYQFPVCARCTGIILGYITAIILLFCNIRLSIINCILFIIPMIIDGTMQYFTSYNSNNIKRLFTGILSGIGFIYLVVNTLWLLAISLVW